LPVRPEDDNDTVSEDGGGVENCAAEVTDETLQDPTSSICDVGGSRVDDDEKSCYDFYG